MKKVFLIATAVASLLFTSVSAQDAPLKAGEKATITFFDFDFAPGYFGYKSAKVNPDAPNDTENKTLYQILRQLEAGINQYYGVTLEPAKYDSTDESKFMTAKCYPKIKTKEALKLGYDKIVEVRAYMKPGADATGGFAGPVSVAKPVIYLNLTILDKDGKKLFNTAAQEKSDERQTTVAFGASGGYTSESILALYKKTLDKLFTKSEKKKKK